MRRLLTVVSGVGLCLSLLLQALAMAFPWDISRCQCSALVFAGISTLVLSRLNPASSEELRPGSLTRFRGLVSQVVGYEWLIWSVVFLFLISPQPGVVVSGMNFSRPFALWKVTALRYRSLDFGWLLSMAAFSFSMTLAGRTRD
jgi:hypothetical protein